MWDLCVGHLGKACREKQQGREAKKQFQERCPASAWLCGGVLQRKVHCRNCLIQGERAELLDTPNYPISLSAVDPH
jgi:hypothetical protein